MIRRTSNLLGNSFIRQRVAQRDALRVDVGDCKLFLNGMMVIIVRGEVASRSPLGEDQVDPCSLPGGPF
jgi:hypothetical protein